MRRVWGSIIVLLLILSFSSCDNTLGWSMDSEGNFAYGNERYVRLNVPEDISVKYITEEHSKFSRNESASYDGTVWYYFYDVDGAIDKDIVLIETYGSLSDERVPYCKISKMDSFYEKLENLSFNSYKCVETIEFYTIYNEVSVSDEFVDYLHSLNEENSETLTEYYFHSFSNQYTCLPIIASDQYGLFYKNMGKLVWKNSDDIYFLKDNSFNNLYYDDSYYDDVTLYKLNDEYTQIAKEIFENFYYDDDYYDYNNDNETPWSQLYNKVQ